MGFFKRTNGEPVKSTNLKIMYAINWIAITIFVAGITWKLIQYLTK